MNREEENRGMALISVLLLSVLLVMIGVSMIFISTQHLHMMGRVEAYDLALKAAEAGAEYALAEFNEDPRWGDPNTFIEKTLNNGSGFVITFDPGDDYYSYNNMFSNELHARPAGKPLQGDVPAYTAEIISVGKAPGGVIKILRVLYIRDDAIPANAYAKGEIACVSGRIVFAGEDDTKPGWLYSDWPLTPVPTAAPSIYSVNVDSTVDAKGGLFSSKSTIEINPAGPDAVYEDEFTTKNVEGADIDIDEIIHEASLDPGITKISNDAYRITTVQGVKDNEIAAFMNDIFKKGDLEDMVPAYSPDPPSGRPAGPGDVYRQHIDLRDAQIDTVTGVTPSWFSEEGGHGKSWHRIEATGSAVEEYCEYVAEDDGLDPNGDPQYKWSDIPVDGTKTHTLTDLVYDMEEREEHWGGQVWDIRYIDTEVAFMRGEPGDIPEEDYTVLPGETLDGCFSLKEISPDEYRVCLSNDVYIQAGAPGGADYTCNLDSVSGDIFTIKRDYNLRDKKTGETVLAIPLDMNGHNLYSEYHVALGLQVKSNDPDGGLMVSKGKLGYIYGIDADPLIPVCKDDLCLSISEEGFDYNLKGYMYTDNDLIIEPVDNGSRVLAGEGVIYTALSLGGKLEVTNCKSYPPEKTFSLDPTNPGAIPSMDVTSSGSLVYARIGDGERYIIPDRGFGITYSDPGGSHEINFGNYQIHFIPQPDGTVMPEIYMEHTFTYPYPPNPALETKTRKEYVKIPFEEYISGAYYAPAIDYSDFRQDVSDFTSDTAMQNAMNDIGNILYKNYLEKNVILKGRIVTNNKHTAADGDNNGDQSVFIAPGGVNSTFTSLLDRGEISALIQARGGDFTVRRVCWEIIK